MPWSISTTWIRAFVRGKSKVAQCEEWKKATFVFSYNYKPNVETFCWNVLTGTNAEIGMSVITFKIYQSKEPNIN